MNAAFRAEATLGAITVSQQDIRLEELARARHSLAYLKRLIGDNAMRDLLAEDVSKMTSRVRDWSIDIPRSRSEELMRIRRAAGQPTQRGGDDNFTGSAWSQTIAVGESPEPLHVVRVTFEPGARTHWHRHPLGQVLMATAGIGRFAVAGGSLVELRPGDSVTFAPGEAHWHGSAPGQLFIHLSIQAADASGIQATWLHPVTDEEYTREPATGPSAKS